MSQGFLTSCRGFMFSWRQNKCSTEKHQDVELPALWTRRSTCFLTVSLTGLLSEMSFLSIISRQKKVFFVLMCFKTQSFSNIRGESRLKTTKRLSSQSEDQHRNCTLTSIVSSLLKFSFWMSSCKTSEKHPVVQTRHASLDGG